MKKDSLVAAITAGILGGYLIGACMGSYMISRHSELDTAQIFRNENGKTIIKNL